MKATGRKMKAIRRKMKAIGRKMKAIGRKGLLIKMCLIKIISLLLLSYFFIFYLTFPTKFKDF